VNPPLALKTLHCVLAGGGFAVEKAEHCPPLPKLPLPMLIAVHWELVEFPLAFEMTEHWSVVMLFWRFFGLFTEQFEPAVPAVLHWLGFPPAGPGADTTEQLLF
jgi:hypothetical protein